MAADLDQAYAGLLHALSDHTAPTGGGDLPPPPDFAEIHLRFAQLKTVLGFTAPDWNTISSGFQDLRLQVGLPPTQAGAPPVLLHAAHRQEQELLRGLDPVWERFTVPAEAPRTAQRDEREILGDLYPVWESFMVPAAALRETHRQLGEHRQAPRWQRIGEVWGAFRHLTDTITKAAGSYTRELVTDARVQGFFQTVGLRVAGVIEQQARSLHQAITSPGQAQARRAALKLQHLAADVVARLRTHASTTGQQETGRRPSPAGTRAQAAALRSPQAPAANTAQHSARPRPPQVPPPSWGTPTGPRHSR
ncbi:hypothetical protein ACOZ38_28405 [Sphaerisporangium viridialbum]|uniref:hypothetical protein n=1 Tax=Sphaerisporangium viridialbum TaxID=46189 RepID=UPI003C70FF83